MKTRRMFWLALVVLTLALQPLAMSVGPGGVVAQEEATPEQGTPTTSANEETENQSDATDDETGQAPPDATPDASEESPTEPTDATPTAVLPETEPTEPAASPSAEPVQAAAIDEIQITLYCDRNPELTRVDNLSANPIQIVSIGSLHGQAAAEPYPVDRTINGGGTLIFRSGSNAVPGVGTFLTTSFLYTDDAYDLDGAEIETDQGTITKQCPPAPPADVNDLRITLSCWNNPETTRIDNLGQAKITIQSISSLYDQSGAEPFVVNRSLGGGKTVIYRSGSGATYTTLFRSVKNMSTNRIL